MKYANRLQELGINESELPKNIKVLISRLNKHYSGLTALKTKLESSPDDDKIKEDVADMEEMVSGYEDSVIKEIDNVSAAIIAERTPAALADPATPPADLATPPAEPKKDNSLAYTLFGVLVLGITIGTVNFLKNNR